MRFERLTDWLSWQETLHPTGIDLGLERVARVARRLGVDSLPCPVITVAGTNGKGTCIAVMESVLRAAGHCTGAYTSPHLQRYNERICLGGQQVTDAALCAAFEKIDLARDDISLSYFEFGTLAALELFRRAAPDVVLLEVGLGGRLDAVNTVAPDVAVITTVDIDHTQWLGTDREQIGREKAGILRSGRPALLGDPDMPQSIFEQAQALGAPLVVSGRDFVYQADGPDRWRWRDKHLELAGLPRPPLPGAAVLQNAATALAALHYLPEALRPDRTAIETGLRAVRPPGRCQVLPGPVETLLDVAHNPQAAHHLAAALRSLPARGRTHAVVGILADKDVSGTLSPLVPGMDTWHLAGLSGERGLSTATLGAALQPLAPDTPRFLYEDVVAAYRGALTQAAAGDRVVVFGSFHTVAGLLDAVAAGTADTAVPDKT